MSKNEENSQDGIITLFEKKQSEYEDLRKSNQKYEKYVLNLEEENNYLKKVNKLQKEHIENLEKSDVFKEDLKSTTDTSKSGSLAVNSKSEEDVSLLQSKIKDLDARNKKLENENKQLEESEKKYEQEKLKIENMYKASLEGEIQKIKENCQKEIDELKASTSSSKNSIET